MFSFTSQKVEGRIWVTRQRLRSKGGGGDGEDKGRGGRKLSAIPIPWRGPFAQMRL